MFNHMTMTESAALLLRKGIMQGDYPPGCRLVPAKLEEDLKLSRTAIREAIRELVGTGLADSQTHKGACVAEPLDFSEIRQIFRIRYELEGEAAFLGTQQITAEEVEKMEALLDQMSRPETAKRYLDFLLNQQFHTTLYGASRWRYLVKVIDRMYDQVLVFRGGLYQHFTEAERETFLNWNNFQPYHEDHIRIMSFVKKRDGESARQAVVENLKRGLDGLETIHGVLSKQKRLSI